MNFLIFSLLLITAINLAGLLWAYTRQSDHATDLIYGSSFFLTTLLLYLYQGDFSFTKSLLTLMICSWGARLALFLFRRIKNMKKDDRFDNMRPSFAKFAGFWFLQTITIFIVLLPVIFFLDSTPTLTQFSFLSLIGFVIWAAGFAIETIADQQKNTFRNNATNKGQFIKTGLWKYAQHPNYSGEILCWIGVFVYVIPALQGWGWISILSPLWISFMLIKVSGIPFLIKSSEKKYGHLTAYQVYKKTTPRLFPGVY